MLHLYLICVSKSLNNLLAVVAQPDWAQMHAHAHTVWAHVYCTGTPQAHCKGCQPDTAGGQRDVYIRQGEQQDQYACAAQL